VHLHPAAVVLDRCIQRFGWKSFVWIGSDN